MSSIWTNTASIDPREPLGGDTQTEAAVIGGGLAGILIARFLSDAGVNTILLEADRIGSGQTKNTTAKITAQHAQIYTTLIKNFGKQNAALYAKANLLAIEKYKELIEKDKIACDFEECDNYIYTLSDAQKLVDEADAAKSLGIDAEFTVETELPFKVKGAVKFFRQAKFHPLKFLKAASQPLRVFENTRATAVSGNKIYTDRGMVTARYIVVATHFPFMNTPGYFFLRMHQERSYAISYKNVPTLAGTYLGVDPDSAWSFRSGPEGQLILGGGGHRTGQKDISDKYRLISDAAARFYPGCEETARWSAQDCMPHDGVPLIGHFGEPDSGLYVATGFKKWGMTSAMVSAMIIPDLILGRENRFAELFSPRRFNLPAAAKSLLEDGFITAKGLTKRAFCIPKEQLLDLSPGESRVIILDGHKAGVYKDEDGAVHAVSLKCPHLGCQPEANDTEKSWDCPCHGSRFDLKGKLIDGPAQENLEYEKL